MTSALSGLSLKRLAERRYITLQASVIGQGIAQALRIYIISDSRFAPAFSQTSVARNSRASAL